MPKKLLPKKKSKRQVRRSPKLSAGKVKKKVILFTGIAVLLLGIVFLQPWKFVGQQITTLSQGQPVTMPKPESKQAKSVTLEPDEAKTVFLKTEKGATISIYFPSGSVGRKMPLSIAVAEDETGVILRPEGTKFLRPVSITFDLTDTSQRSDAPDKIDNDKPRTTGKTHLYSVDSKGNVTPTLIARGMETSVLVSGRTLFTGAYVLRTDDKSAEKYAKATLDNPESYFFSVLESAATLFGSSQPLTESQRANAKKAVDKVLTKKSAPMFELYAAMVVNKALEGNNMSFVGLAYAESDLEAQLRKTCSEDTHAIETYINAELLAKLQGFNEIAQLCRQTGDKVLRINAQRLFNNTNASFEEVMVMIGQVKSIEGTNSVLLTNMEHKLEQVVDRDIRNIVKNPSASLDEIMEVYERKGFTLVDPALSKELDRVTFVEAREQIEKVLAKDCPLPRDVLYAKSLVIQYQLDDLKSRVDAKKECPGGYTAAPDGGNPPPPPPGGGEGGNGGSSVPPEVVGTCYYAYSWSYNVVGDGVCQVCYDAVTDDHRQDLIESKCVSYACEAEASMWDRFNKKCKMDVDMYEDYAGKHTDPDWQPLDDELPLEPLPQDPPIPDSLDGSSEGQDSSSSDDNSSEEGSSSDDGSAPQNEWDLGL